MRAPDHGHLLCDWRTPFHIDYSHIGGWSILSWRNYTSALIILTFSSTLPASNAGLPLQLAGWHTHLDFLAEALNGQAVDWPHWPIDRWTRHYERYTQKRRAKQEGDHSSQKGNL